jgi:DNA-binding CsgD family transcriptional regulator/FtsH-binding integral membrane protein
MMPPTVQVVFIVLISVASMLCLYMSARSIAQTAVPPEDILPASQAQDTTSKAQGESGRHRRLPPPLWSLLAAFALYSFVLTFRLPMSTHPEEWLMFVFYYGALIVIASWYWVLFVKQSITSPQRVFQVLLLVFALGFFLQYFAAGIASEMISNLFLTGTMLVYMVVWMTVIDSARSSHFHVFLIVGVWGACYGCPRILYYFVRVLSPSTGGVMDLSTAAPMIALFSLLIAFFLLSRSPVGLRPFFSELTGAYQSQEDAPTLRQRWEGIAQHHQLTAREAEIFMLVCEGHSRPYIAEHLFISENTVKAHLKRIYAKLGVHSKSELERLIWSENPAT